MKTRTISFLLASLGLGVLAAPMPMPDAALDLRGRSGYNSVPEPQGTASSFRRVVTDNVVTTDGRSGYNKERDVDYVVTTGGSSGYNKERDVAGAHLGRDRSGSNEVGADDVETDARSGYNKL